MPFYDYRCEECEERFEENRPMDRRDDAVCPKCGSRHVRRLVSQVSALSGGGCGPSPSVGGG
jgi:putative FmdB family regulatory protein